MPLPHQQPQQQSPFSGPVYPSGPGPAGPHPSNMTSGPPPMRPGGPGFVPKGPEDLGPAGINGTGN